MSEAGQKMEKIFGALDGWGLQIACGVSVVLGWTMVGGLACIMGWVPGWLAFAPALTLLALFIFVMITALPILLHLAMVDLSE